jgi:hypothetical protein
VAQGHAGLTPQARQLLRESFESFVRYVQAFRVVAQAVMLTQRQKVHGCNPAKPVDAQFNALLTERRGDLLRMAQDLADYAASTDLIHRVYTLLDPDRLLALHGDIERQLAALRQPA